MVQFDKKWEITLIFLTEIPGTSPLYEAVIGGAVDIARILIHAKADVNMRKIGEENGPDTPLTK